MMKITFKAAFWGVFSFLIYSGCVAMFAAGFKHRDAKEMVIATLVAGLYAWCRRGQ